MSPNSDEENKAEEKKDGPIAQWLKKEAEKPEVCRPCFLSVLAPWYRDELDEKGYGEEARAIEVMGETEDPLTLGRKLDEIRGRLCAGDAGICQRLTELNQLMFDSEEEIGGEQAV
jgi:hypothetical protein